MIAFFLPSDTLYEAYLLQNLLVTQQLYIESSLFCRNHVICMRVYLEDYDRSSNGTSHTRMSGVCASYVNMFWIERANFTHRKNVLFKIQENAKQQQKTAPEKIHVDGILYFGRLLVLQRTAHVTLSCVDIVLSS
jgi:hypothetical protein